jgi:hypothetical protein
MIGSGTVRLNESGPGLVTAVERSDRDMRFYVCQYIAL